MPAAMQIISTIAELRVRLSGEHAVAFVPTMGNLHDGHLSLMKQAREYGNCVVASIFVNPLQFSPHEDFDRYPRTLTEDCAKLRGLVDIVFAPSTAEMYPVQQNIFVELPATANDLCGTVRPGHFRGMATVVLKLFDIVQPQVVLLGKKDYQQLHIIRHMVTQLNLPISIIGAETIRDADGLALSSRNQYLTAAERDRASLLARTLNEMRQAILHGERDYERLQQQAVEVLTSTGWIVDYVAVRNQSDLLPAGQAQQALVILAAARLGNTRLLDNVELHLAG
jgi:pantoate--beta-alanine ligase